MSINQLYIQLDELRVAIGRFAPDDPQRKRALRQFFPLVGAIAQQEQETDPQINLLNRHLELLIDQAKKVDIELASEEIKLELLKKEILGYAMGEIYQSGKLWQNKEIKYEDAYNIALLQITNFFYCNYHKYDSSRARVTTWLDNHFQWRFNDQKKLCQKIERLEINNVTSSDDESLELIDMMKSPSYGYASDLIKREILNWIETEPKLHQIHIRNRPDITAYVLLKRRFPVKSPWSQLSKEFNIVVATLSRFYETKCKPELISFTENNHDVDPPDSPINPCQNMRAFLKDSSLEVKNFKQKLNDWIETNEDLRIIHLRNHEIITGYLFFKKLIEVVSRKQEGLEQLAKEMVPVEREAENLPILDPKSEEFKENTKQLEQDLAQFYEFHILPLLQNFVHNIKEN